MPLGLLSAIVAVPAITGTTEAVRHGQRQNAREEHRGRKSELQVSLPAGSPVSAARRQELDGALIVLRGGKLWIKTNSEASRRLLARAHPFTGYLLQHPAQAQWRAAGHAPDGEGLVTTISEDPPMLNWVYVDPRTHEVKYGTRAEVEEAGGIGGPWDVTAGVGTDRGTGLMGGGRRMMFEGWEGFVGVEEEVEAKTVNGGDGEGEEEEEKDDDEQLWLDGEEGNSKNRDRLWGLYFDVKDNGLSSGGRIGSRGEKPNMLEVELIRRERKRTKQMAVEERVERIQARKAVDRKIEERKEG